MFVDRDDGLPSVPLGDKTAPPTLYPIFIAHTHSFLSTCMHSPYNEDSKATQGDFSPGSDAAMLCLSFDDSIRYSICAWLAFLPAEISAYESHFGLAGHSSS